MPYTPALMDVNDIWVSMQEHGKPCRLGSNSTTITRMRPKGKKHSMRSADAKLTTSTGKELLTVSQLKKMLDDARSLLKEMSKTPAASSSKKAKAEPKKSMKKK